MGAIAKYTTAKMLLPDLNPCDMIEFNRITFSHYAFYIGDGICVHVTRPGGGTFSTSSTSAVTQCGGKCAEHLFTIAGNSPCRINNQEMVAKLHNIARRDTAVAIAMATEGLERDSTGRLILGRGIPWNYAVVGNSNCEGWTAHWRYNCLGWSHQAANGVISSSVGTLERLFEGAAAVLEDTARTDNIVKGTFATTGLIIYKVAALPVSVVRTITDWITAPFLHR